STACASGSESTHALTCLGRISRSFGGFPRVTGMLSDADISLSCSLRPRFGGKCTMGPQRKLIAIENKSIDPSRAAGGGRRSHGLVRLGRGVRPHGHGGQAPSPRRLQGPLGRAELLG